jgi:hypothetical protein
MAQILGELRRLLSNRTSFIEILNFASNHHAIAAGEITQVITDYITNVSERSEMTIQAHENNIEYLYYMDSILKHVQGNYIGAFGTNINYLMHLVFHRASKIPDGPMRAEMLQKLLKIFKTWEVLGLFAPVVMCQIADANQLRQLVSQLLEC